MLTKLLYFARIDWTLRYKTSSGFVVLVKPAVPCDTIRDSLPDIGKHFKTKKTRMRFLHTADLHIDSPLRGLSRHEGAPLERLLVVPPAAHWSAWPIWRWTKRSTSC